MKKMAKAATLAVLFHLSLHHGNHIHLHEDHVTPRKAVYAIAR